MNNDSYPRRKRDKSMSEREFVSSTIEIKPRFITTNIVRSLAYITITATIIVPQSELWSRSRYESQSITAARRICVDVTVDAALWDGYNDTTDPSITAFLSSEIGKRLQEYGERPYDRRGRSRVVSRHQEGRGISQCDRTSDILFDVSYAQGGDKDVINAVVKYGNYSHENTKKIVLDIRSEPKMGRGYAQVYIYKNLVRLSSDAANLIK